MFYCSRAAGMLYWVGLEAKDHQNPTLEEEEEQERMEIWAPIGGFSMLVSDPERRWK